MFVAALGTAGSMGHAATAADEAPHGATSTASSMYSSGFEAEYASDGDFRTRWCSSTPYGPQEWLQIDLGDTRPIGRVELHS